MIIRNFIFYLLLVSVFDLLREVVVQCRSVSTKGYIKPLSSAELGSRITNYLVTRGYIKPLSTVALRSGILDRPGLQVDILAISGRGIHKSPGWLVVANGYAIVKVRGIVYIYNSLLYWRAACGGGNG
jgi:hypothetical protein